MISSPFTHLFSASLLILIAVLLASVIANGILFYTAKELDLNGLLHYTQ
jgi:hypothetical protein